MNSVLNKQFISEKSKLETFIYNFEEEGVQLGKADRNTIKCFNLNGLEINIKSFKVPNVINKIVYRFFRKSKAQRSYEYANKLTNLGVGTPQPIAYYEFVSPFVFKNSYYISEHINCDLTYRELTTNFNYPNHEAILRAFARFTFNLHEKGIHFLDHSPGNTLIEIKHGGYKFYLVDLNRMEFKPLDFETRIKNFAKLTIHKEMVEVMSDEYAKCSGVEYSKVFNLMWSETEAFQARYHRKRRMKNKVKFWKSAR
ncbi:lipopolysaccharide kinase InaA family protein [Algibacter sp. PT7-4]|uniref:lipopolysaccharide kinase InaA family protein n=1 Tax=Algibacter ulvanivorans TaxID=3400999 RepID=UPI003AAB3327